MPVAPNKYKILYITPRCALQRKHVDRGIGPCQEIIKGVKIPNVIEKQHSLRLKSANTSMYIIAKDIVSVALPRKNNAQCALDELQISVSKRELAERRKKKGT